MKLYGVYVRRTSRRIPYPEKTFVVFQLNHEHFCYCFVVHDHLWSGYVYVERHFRERRPYTEFASMTVRDSGTVLVFIGIRFDRMFETYEFDL